MSNQDQHPFKRRGREGNLADPVSDRPPAMLVKEVIDAISIGIMSWDENGVCTLFNRPAQLLLELPDGKLFAGLELSDHLMSEQDRGSLTGQQVQDATENISLNRRFTFDYALSSGEVVRAAMRPLRGGGYVMTLISQTETNRTIDAADAARAAAEAAQAEATRVLQEERARQRAAELLAQMDGWLQSCKTLSELYDILKTFMQMALPGSLGQLFIYSKSREELVLTAAWNCDAGQDHIVPDSCWALRRGRGYIYDPKLFGFSCKHAKDAKPEAATDEPSTCIPIIAHGETVGLLHVALLPDADNPDIADPFRFVRDCAEHVSMAIANVKLRDELQDQSQRDPLTSLYNRRVFLETMRKEISRAAAQEASFALLSFDADHFKSFNDKYGHDAGDAVLVGISERMRALDVPDAVPCRLGGEEFAMVLPGADRTRAIAAAEDLRQAIEEMRVKYIGGRLPKVTVSIGVAVYPTHGTDPMDLIKQSDLALYEAKDAGRNCWRMRSGVDMVTFD